MMKNINLNNMLLLLFIVISLNTGVEASTQFKVGERIGWSQPDKNNTAVYSQWAVKNRFLVGDSLLFEYTNDSVLVVDKAGYYHCNLANPISNFNDGKTVIKLDKPGPIYFVSGAPDHCKNGQRLVVNVITLHPTPQIPPSSIASPPLPFFPAASPAPSPDSDSAFSVFGFTSILVTFLTTSIATVVLV